MARLAISLEPVNQHAAGACTAIGADEEIQCICHGGDRVGWDALAKYVISGMTEYLMEAAASRRLLVTVAHRRLTQYAGTRGEWKILRNQAFVEHFVVGEDGKTADDCLNEGVGYHPESRCQLRSMHSMRAVVTVAEESLPGDGMAYIETLNNLGEEGEVTSRVDPSRSGSLKAWAFPDVDTEWAVGGSLHAGPISIAPWPKHCDAASQGMFQVTGPDSARRRRGTPTEEEILEEHPEWRASSPVYPGDLFLFPWSVVLSGLEPAESALSTRRPMASILDSGRLPGPGRESRGLQSVAEVPATRKGGVTPAEGSGVPEPGPVGDGDAREVGE